MFQPQLLLDMIKCRRSHAPYRGPYGFLRARNWTRREARDDTARSVKTRHVTRDTMVKHRLRPKTCWRRETVRVRQCQVGTSRSSQARTSGLKGSGQVDDLHGGCLTLVLAWSVAFGVGTTLYLPHGQSSTGHPDTPLYRLDGGRNLNVLHTYHSLSLRDCR
jgi:hypothetical protein